MFSTVVVAAIDCHPMSSRKKWCRKHHLHKKQSLMLGRFFLLLIVAHVTHIFSIWSFFLPPRQQEWETFPEKLNNNNHLPHPHAGAQDENGAWGYIADPYAVHRLPLETVACPGPPTTLEGLGGRQVLEKIRRGLLRSRHRRRSPRILCMVYSHQGANDRIQAIASTWGRQCDGFWVASNHTDRKYGAVNLAHAGPESYENMWQKIRSMWAYAYDVYMEDFDYFHICGDDVYVMVDNLRAYALLLEEEQQQQQMNNSQTPWDIYVRQHWAEAQRWAGVNPRPLLLAVPNMAHKRKQGTYPNGGPGYTLNRRALQLFGEEGLDSFLVNNTDPREDVFMGGFFASQGIWTSDTRDAQGGWRYGGNGDAQETFLYDGVRGSQMAPKRMGERYPGFSLLPHLDGVSEQMVSLHLKNPGKRARVNPSIPDLIRRYHSILHRSSECDEEDNNHDTLMEKEQQQPDRPTGLRLVMLGDSVDRYQYLSLVYYLRWGQWFNTESTGESPPTFRTFLFHEKDGGSWNDYFAGTNRILLPYEACDCYR